MHVDGAVIYIDVGATNIVEQLTARKDTAGRLHQEFQETEFRRAEFEFAFLAVDAVLLAVELEVAKAQHMRQKAWIDPAQHGFDASKQLRCRERLDHIIVRAGRKAA